jgi:hypothetical protein
LPKVIGLKIKKRRRTMKKIFFFTLALALVLSLASIGYAADEALTPEKLCGIWEGNYNIDSTRVGLPRYSAKCRILFKSDLSGIMRYNTVAGMYKVVFDGQRDINNNQLIIRDPENPDIVRLKAYMTKKNKLEGEFQGKVSFGDLVGFKKIRDLTDDEKQQSMEQLEILLY